MNFQELLMRLSASCFAADQPDYDWKTLRLFPETGLDLVLIVRLAAALILCVIGALVHNTVVQYILLALSALAAGYDYLASAIACILDRQVFRPAANSCDDTVTKTSCTLALYCCVHWNTDDVSMHLHPEIRLC